MLQLPSRDKAINNRQASEAIDANYKTVLFEIPDDSSSIDWWQ